MRKIVIAETQAFQYRMPLEIHHKLRWTAYQMGISMNEVLNNILKVQLAKVEPPEYLDFELPEETGKPQPPEGQSWMDELVEKAI
jgi:hypothetical protein